jgi:hypothetical protein
VGFISTNSSRINESNHSPPNPIFLLISGVMPPIFSNRRSYLTFPFDEDYDVASPSVGPSSLAKRDTRMFDRPSIISFASFGKIAICTLLAACFAFPQNNSGAITGKVIDQDGATVSGVSIRARNLYTGTAYKTTSSSSGDYSFERLGDGTYQISFPTLGLGAPPQNVVVHAGTVHR